MHTSQRAAPCRQLTSNQAPDLETAATLVRALPKTLVRAAGIVPDQDRAEPRAKLHRAALP